MIHNHRASIYNRKSNKVIDSKVIKQVIIYKDEDDYWVVKCPSLKGCVSQNKTRKEALLNIKEAISDYIIALEEDGLPFPEEDFETFFSGCVSKLPRVSGKNCVKALQKIGFYPKRRESSHIILRRDAPFAQVVIRDHQELATGTLRAIIRDARLNLEEFI